MEQVENIARLEAAIDKLLKSLQEIRQEKIQLQVALDQKEKEVAELKKQVEAIQSERSKIHQRVAGLIETIDKWEKMTGEQDLARGAKAKTDEGSTLF